VWFTRNAYRKTTKHAADRVKAINDSSVDHTTDDKAEQRVKTAMVDVHSRSFRVIIIVIVRPVRAVVVYVPCI
ncbi:Hypothetical protein UVM_LOCUS225, partial [uncultured virus]